jgi:hypothetical protein
MRGDAFGQGGKSSAFQNFEIDFPMQKNNNKVVALIKAGFLLPEEIRQSTIVLDDVPEGTRFHTAPRPALIRDQNVEERRYVSGV